MKKKKFITVAIDSEASAGGGTQAKLIAKHYNLVDTPMNKGIIDLSLFIINPFNWHRIPAKDKGILPNIKKLFMPRYMNHRDDPIFKEQTINCSDALTYGVLGESACIYNYIDILNKKDVFIKKS